MEDEEEMGGGGDQSHQKLLEKVQNVIKSSRVKQRTEGAIVASEFHLAPTNQDGKVSMENLLKGLGSTQNKSLLDLKKRLGSMQEPLEAPLNKTQANKANREAANQQTSKEVGKWAPIVKRNREAEHLSFPLQPDHIPPASISTKLKNFTPSTELEREVAAILAKSENVEGKKQELTAAERKSLFEMSVEEAMERKKALQKHRSLVSFYEQKCRRLGRIKSKKFHRVRRKQLEKISGRKEYTEEELMKLRAKERMTLKHSSKAKWAKKQHTREHRDPATQLALTEHHQRKNQLKEKLPPVQVEEDAADSQQETDEETDIAATPIMHSDSANPWLGSLASAPMEKSSTFKPKPSSASTAFSKKAPSSTLGDHIDTHLFMNSDRGGVGGGVRDLGPASQHLLSIMEAFSADDVVEEFEKEKAELEEEQKTTTDTSAAMPGWGRWGGEGVNPRKRVENRRQRPQPRKKPRRDAGMKHVIIAEEQNKKLSRHLVQAVPWPYTSKEQFDKTHSMPVGRHWNTEATYQHLIRPRVSTKTGVLIEPLVLTEEVQNYMEKSTVTKKRTRTRRTKNNPPKD